MLQPLPHYQKLIFDGGKVGPKFSPVAIERFSSKLLLNQFPSFQTEAFVTEGIVDVGADEAKIRLEFSDRGFKLEFLIPLVTQLDYRLDGATQFIEDD